MFIQLLTFVLLLVVVWVRELLSEYRVFVSIAIIWYIRMQSTDKHVTIYTYIHVCMRTGLGALVLYIFYANRFTSLGEMAILLRCCATSKL